MNRSHGFVPWFPLSWVPLSDRVIGPDLCESDIYTAFQELHEGAWGLPVPGKDDDAGAAYSDDRI